MRSGKIGLLPASILAIVALVIACVYRDLKYHPEVRAELGQRANALAHPALASKSGTLWIKNGEVVWTEIGQNKIAKVQLVANEDVPVYRTQMVRTRIRVLPLDAHHIPQTMRMTSFVMPGSPGPDTEIVAKFLKSGFGGEVVEDNLLVPYQVIFKGHLLRFALEININS